MYFQCVCAPKHYYCHLGIHGAWNPRVDHCFLQMKCTHYHYCIVRRFLLFWFFFFFLVTQRWSCYVAQIYPQTYNPHASSLPNARIAGTFHHAPITVSSFKSHQHMSPVSMDLGYCQHFCCKWHCGCRIIDPGHWSTHEDVSVKYLPRVGCFISCKMCSLWHPRRSF